MAKSFRLNAAGGQIIKSEDTCILATCLQKAKQKEIEVKRKQKLEKGAEQGAKRKETVTPISSAPAKRQNAGRHLLQG